jgi:hypothetical protein
LNQNFLKIQAPLALPLFSNSEPLVHSTISDHRLGTLRQPFPAEGNVTHLNAQRVAYSAQSQGKPEPASSCIVFSVCSETRATHVVQRLWRTVVAEHEFRFLKYFKRKARFSRRCSRQSISNVSILTHTNLNYSHDILTPITVNVQTYELHDELSFMIPVSLHETLKTNSRCLIASLHRSYPYRPKRNRYDL